MIWPWPAIGIPTSDPMPCCRYATDRPLGRLSIPISPIRKLGISVCMIPGKQEIWQTKCTETREIENAHAVCCETNDVIEIVLKMTKSCFLKSPTHNECCKIRFTYVTKPKTQSELNDTNFLSYWLPIHSKFTLGNSMLKAERKETGKTISLSVIRDSPRKLTAVLEIRICFKFYFFQFLMLQHNCVMDQLTIHGKFYNW